MKFVKMTLGYFTIKKFFQLILVALIPSFLLANISSLSSISDFIVNYEDKDLSSFNTIYNQVSEFHPGRIIFYILVISIFIISIAELLGIVERDMRVGDFTVRGFFRRLNNNFYAVSLTVVLFIASILLMGVVIAALFLLWAFIMPGIAAHIVSSITALIFFTLLVFVWANFLYVMPTMIITGLSALQSTRESIKQTHGIFFDLVIAIIVPLFPAFFFIYLERALQLDIKFIMDIVINDLLIVYYVVMILASYHDTAGLAREDLNPASRYFS